MVRRLVEAQSRCDKGQAQDGGTGARQQDHQPEDGETDVNPQRGEVIMGGANDGQVSTGKCRDQQRHRASIAPPLPDQPRSRGGSENQMQQDVADVKKRGRRKRRNISGVQQRYEQKEDQSTTRIAKPPPSANSGKILLR